MSDHQTTDLLVATIASADMIAAIYKHVDQIEKAGGPLTPSGQHLCVELAASLIQNRQRVQQLVMEPVQSAVQRATS